MNRKTVQRVLMCIVCLTIVLAAGGFAYYGFLVRGPLAGDTSHDFGEVVVSGAKAEVSHTFHLINRTDRTITISRVMPECGCVQVTPGSATVASGESLNLNAVLSVFSTGTKTTSIRLVMDTGKIQFLHVKATGRRTDAAPTNDLGSAAQPSAGPTPLPASAQPN